jgi:anti-sigma factor RsiW
MSRAPTDLELMLHFDGELEEPRRSEVAEWLRSAPDAAVAHQKLRGLELGARWTQTVALEGDVEHGFDPAAVDAIVARASREAPMGAVPSRASNDNGARSKRRVAVAGFFVTAAAAAAAWIGFVLVDGTSTDERARAAAGSSRVELAALGRSASSASYGTSAMGVAPLGFGSGVVVDDAAPVEESAGVRVDSIDFGAQSGTIYSVMGDPRGTATTVLWVADR